MTAAKVTIPGLCAAALAPTEPPAGELIPPGAGWMC
jgi:hypothetical protein